MAFEFSVKEKESVNVPLWAGVGAIAVGAFLLLAGGPGHYEASRYQLLQSRHGKGRRSAKDETRKFRHQTPDLGRQADHAALRNQGLTSEVRRPRSGFWYSGVPAPQTPFHFPGSPVQCPKGAEGAALMAGKSLNRVTLIGNLGKDAESKFTPNGTSVATFSIATSWRQKDQQTGEWKEQMAHVDATVAGTPPVRSLHTASPGNGVALEIHEGKPPAEWLEAHRRLSRRTPDEARAAASAAPPT